MNSDTLATMSERNVAVVTGANTGIGLGTARGLALLGHDVVLLCRNADKAEAARGDIAGSVPDADVSVVIADMGVMDDVRRAAGEIGERFDRLDVLVNNAGMTIRSRELTSEANDVMLAVNHLGPFLLTHLLLPLLKRSAPARIVNVASEAHKFGRDLDLDDLQATRGYGLAGLPRYGEVKLMNILFTRELARRLDGTGVVANCLHPGAVRTNLGNPPAPLRWLLGKFFLSPEGGAQTSLAVATSPEFAETSGTYFVASRPADRKLAARAKNDEAAAQLWKQSAALTGI